MRQLAGIRTTTPAFPSAGTSFRNCRACCGLQRSGWKMSPASTMAFNQGQFSAARWTASAATADIHGFSHRHTPARPCREADAGPWPQPKVGSCRSQKREWGVLVLPVLGKIEMNAPNQVPGRMTALQKLLHGEPGISQLSIEGRIHALPKIGQDGRRQVFPANHRRNGRGHRVQFAICGDRHRRLGTAVSDTRKSAQCGHVADPSSRQYDSAGGRIVPTSSAPRHNSPWPEPRINAFSNRNP